VHNPCRRSERNALEGEEGDAVAHQCHSAKNACPWPLRPTIRVSCLLDPECGVPSPQEQWLWEGGQDGAAIRLSIDILSIGFVVSAADEKLSTWAYAPAAARFGSRSRRAQLIYIYIYI
jgi:hypothetical protein